MWLFSYCIPRAGHDESLSCLSKVINSIFFVSQWGYCVGGEPDCFANAWLLYQQWGALRCYCLKCWPESECVGPVLVESAQNRVSNWESFDFYHMWTCYYFQDIHRCGCSLHVQPQVGQNCPVANELLRSHRWVLICRVSGIRLCTGLCKMPVNVTTGTQNAIISRPNGFLE